MMLLADSMIGRVPTAYAAFESVVRKEVGVGKKVEEARRLEKARQSLKEASPSTSPLSSDATRYVVR